MLYTEVNEFNWSVDNAGSTWTDAALGAAVTANASANTKGTAVSLITGSSVTEDVYGVSLSFCGAGIPSASRRFLADFLIDEAGGTSWTTKIANLLINNPKLDRGGGHHFYFPLYIKSGTSVGLQQQCSTGGVSLRCTVRLYGKPSHPHLLKVGHRVETIGANTSTTEGTSITPGSGAYGSYTSSIGTTSNNNWWWQMGFALTDASVTAGNGAFDIKAGDGTNDKMCMEGVQFSNDGNEASGKEAYGSHLPIRLIASGANIYARAAQQTTPDTGFSVCVYGVS